MDTRVIYCGDNLEQLKKLPDACVDLVYIDPPFNSNRNYEGVPNKTQVGDMGIDGRIFPVSATPKTGASFGQLDFMDQWYPIQVKQKDKAGRPDIDSFEAVMMREDRSKGFFVAFDFSSDALAEIDSFFRKQHKVIVALTVKEILEEQIAKKLA